MPPPEPPFGSVARLPASGPRRKRPPARPRSPVGVSSGGGAQEERMTVPVAPEAPAPRQGALSFQPLSGHNPDPSAAPQTQRSSHGAASSSPPPCSPRAFAPRASAPPGSPPGAATHRTPAAAGSSAGPGARRPGLHASSPQALGLRARRRRWTRSLRPPHRGCTGWPRLSHWLRARAGRGRARNLGRGERSEPGGTRAAGGVEATESSPRRACEGFPGSATRAATEHAQSPAGGAGAGPEEGPLLGPRAGPRPRLARLVRARRIRGRPGDPDT
ncbi:proline-rich protein 2-like [Lontra canadensis]|uniref:proline-rich protein 2-like n=1 Tax=Lontra canadensis TaxID=76717 RepID=UPI0013F3972F|nr:proline-rich protein 2-like [Lontra canadensis]